MNKSSEIKYCECGCGKSISCDKRFVHGHNKPTLGKGKPKTPSHPCECGCGEMTKEGSRFISGHNAPFQGKQHSEESRKKMSISHKGLATWNKGLKGVMVAWNKGLNTKSGMEGKKHSESAKKKMAQAKIGGHRSIKSRAKQSLNSRINPNYGMGGKRHTEEVKLQLSKKVKELWQDKNYSDMMYKAHAIRPNKPETLILNILNELYPNEWKYTGDFSFMINGKNPDFVNVNGQKKIIELFGDYWHDGDNPQDRIDVFKPFGYDTLVIWEHELKDIDSVKSLIKKFSEKRNECQA